MSATKTSLRDRQTIEAAAAVAFATGELVVLAALGLVVVPDTVMVEGLANGHDTPPTTSLVRADGRTAYLFRMPT